MLWLGKWTLIQRSGFQTLCHVLWADSLASFANSRSDEGPTLETSVFFTLYGGQFTFSTQLLTLNDLLYSRTYFSDVIKMMDVFSILQEATSDDNLCRMNIGWAPFL